MHQNEDNENYDDEEPYYDSQDQHKHYFKFDPAAWDAWGKWLYDAMKEIVETNPNVWYTPTYIEGWPTKKFPVTGSSPKDTEKHNNFLYLGNNQHDETIWKYKYFISNPLNNEYKNHLIHNAAHIVQQPTYYRSLFEILN